MTIDPKFRFIIGLVVTFCIGVSSGTVVLTNAIPHDWIPIAGAWCGIIAFVGSSVMTGVSALGMTTASRANGAANDSAIDKVVMKSTAQADSMPNSKIVGIGQ